jgi:hypothetical protein
VVPTVRRPQILLSSSALVKTLVGSDARRGVDLDIGDSQPAPGPTPLATPQDGLHPTPELPVAQRLLHHIVGSPLERPDPVELSCPDPDQYQGQVGVHLAGDSVGLPDGAGQVEPRDVGEFGIDEGEVGKRAPHQAKRVPGTVGDDHVEAVGGEVVREEGSGCLVFLGEKDG